MSGRNSSDRGSHTVLVAIIGAIATITTGFVTAHYAKQDQPTSTPAASISVPGYTQTADEFLKSETPSNYQWSGYTADVDHLQSMMNDFLQYLRNHPDTKYADAQSFYGAIDEAASTVMQRAQSKFVPDREQDPKVQNYNQKVFIGPAWFLIHVENMRRAHSRETTLTSGEIDSFQTEFDTWRRTQAGI